MSARGFHRLNCVRCIDHFGTCDKSIEPDCDQVGGWMDGPEAFSRYATQPSLNPASLARRCCQRTRAARGNSTQRRVRAQKARSRWKSFNHPRSTVRRKLNSVGLPDQTAATARPSPKLRLYVCETV